VPDTSAERLQLTDRVARLQLSLDPRVLWPDIRRASLDAELREIVRVTREVLGGRKASLRATAAGDTPKALGVAAFISGMGPLLAHWIERGLLGAGFEQRALLARHYDHGRRRQARLEEQLAGVLDALRTHHVTPIVLKGMATAGRYFPAPGTRTIGDIDVLVRPREHDRARRALTDARYVEVRHTVRASRADWVREGEEQRVRSLELAHVGNPWTIDLHVALERHYHRGLTASLGARAFDAVPLEVAGRQAFGLAQPVLTAWLAIHSGYGLDHLQLVRLVELVLIIRKDVAAGSLSWDGLTALLDETHTTRFAYPGLALAERLAPGTVPPAVIEGGAGAASARARRVVAGLAASGTYRLGHRSLDEKLMWARGPIELLLAVSELAWPGDGTSLAAMGRLHLRRLRAVLAGQTRLRADP